LFDEDEQLFLDILKTDAIENKDHPIVECQVFEFVFVVSKKSIFSLKIFNQKQNQIQLTLIEGTFCIKNDGKLQSNI